jgi:hypothetical protein
MSRAAKQLAIAQLLLPAEHPAAMPPARLHILTPEARARARARAIETPQQ